MPRGISRFLSPVVSLAALMPFVGAAAQEPAPRPAFHTLAVAQVDGSFVIRAPEERIAAPAALRLGKTIRLDRALVAPRTASIATPDTTFNTGANEGGIHEAR